MSVCACRACTRFGPKYRLSTLHWVCMSTLDSPLHQLHNLTTTQVQALDLGSDSTHSHPATAGYTKLKLLKHYRDKDLFFGEKTVAGIKSEQDAKPSSHVKELKVPYRSTHFEPQRKRHVTIPTIDGRLTGHGIRWAANPAFEEQCSSR